MKKLIAFIIWISTMSIFYDGAYGDTYKNVPRNTYDTVKLFILCGINLISAHVMFPLNNTENNFINNDINGI